MCSLRKTSQLSSGVEEDRLEGDKIGGEGQHRSNCSNPNKELNH